MFKGLLGLAATGVVAVVAWKLAAIILLPLLGLALGIAALIIKVLSVLLVLIMGYWMFRRMSRQDSPA